MKMLNIWFEKLTVAKSELLKNNNFAIFCTYKCIFGGGKALRLCKRIP
jgi:hypothetical protein